MKNILIILLIALGLRMINLSGSFWLDESAQAIESARPFSEQLDIVGDFQPPLLHYLTHFAIYFSQTEWWLRMWGALIPALISIFLTYKIAEKYFGEKTAILASILLSTSSFNIFFSQELRPYSLSMLFGTLSSFFLLKILNSKPDKQKYQIAGFIISSILGLYSSYVYVFFLISQLACLMWQKINIGKIAIIAGSIALFYLPWLPMFFKQLQAGQLLRTQMPGWENVVSLSQLKSIPLTLGKFIYGNIYLDINLGFVLATIIIGALSIFLLWNFSKQRKNDQEKKQFLIIATIFSLTLLLTWIVSFWVPVIQPKRLIFLQPFLYILISALIYHQQKTSKLKIASYSLTAILVIINFFSTYQIMTNQLYQREDWRSLHQEIKTRFPSDDTLIINSYMAPFSPWDWYDKEDEFTTLSTGKYYIEDVPDLVETLKPINDFEYLLVFDYLRDLTDPNDKLIQEIEAYGFRGIGVIDSQHIGFVRIYTKNNNNISQHSRCLKLL